MGVKYSGSNDESNWGDNVKPANISFTIGIRMDSGTTPQFIWGKDYSDPRANPFTSYQIYANPGGNYFLDIKTKPAGAVAITGSTVDSGDKHYLTGTYDGTTAEFFEDGSSQGTDAETGDIDYSNNYLGSGLVPSLTIWDLDAVAGEHAIWSGDIGSTMVQALANGANPFIVRNDILDFYAPSYGTSQYDYVGQLTPTETGVTKGDWHPPTEMLENYL